MYRNHICVSMATMVTLKQHYVTLHEQSRTISHMFPLQTILPFVGQEACFLSHILPFLQILRYAVLFLTFRTQKKQGHHDFSVSKPYKKTPCCIMVWRWCLPRINNVRPSEHVSDQRHKSAVL
jgi:hypothetical protein